MVSLFVRLRGENGKRGHCRKVVATRNVEGVSILMLIAGTGNALSLSTIIFYYIAAD